jgi:predicted nucleotidyltransferase
MLADSKLALPTNELADFCRRHNIIEFAIFGSALRADFGPDSDIDVLVTFAPGVVYSLSRYVAMQDELEQLFGRSVDLIDKQAVEESPNYIRKGAILESAEVVYAG